MEPLRRARRRARTKIAARRLGSHVSIDRPPPAPRPVPQAPHDRSRDSFEGGHVRERHELTEDGSSGNFRLPDLPCLLVPEAAPKSGTVSSNELFERPLRGAVEVGRPGELEPDSPSGPVSSLTSSVAGDSRWPAQSLSGGQEKGGRDDYALSGLASVHP